MRTQEEAANYRIFLENLIITIISKIPNINEHQAILCELESAKSSLFYQAPEILDNTWHKIASILTIYLPLNPDDSKNPQFVKDIRTVWMDAKNNFETDPSTDQFVAASAQAGS